MTASASLLMRVLQHILNVFAILIGFLFFLCVVLINKTLQIQIINNSGEALFANKPFIFAIWHQNTFAPFYLYRHQQIAMFVSDNFKGKVIGYVAKKLGYDTLSLERDDSRSIIKMKNKLMEGQNCLMAVDGPSGPSKVIKNGAQFLTEKTMIPTLAVAVDYECAIPLVWRWDAYKIPCPFSRVTIQFSTCYTFPGTWDHFSDNLKK